MNSPVCVSTSDESINAMNPLAAARLTSVLQCHTASECTSSLSNTREEAEEEPADLEDQQQLVDLRMKQREVKRRLRAAGGSKCGCSSRGSSRSSRTPGVAGHASGRVACTQEVLEEEHATPTSKEHVGGHAACSSDGNVEGKRKTEEISNPFL